MILNMGFFLRGRIVIMVIVFLSLIFSGCATIILSQKNMEIRDHLLQAKGLLIQGKHESAVKKYEMILANYEINPWKDKVFFNLGHLYACLGGHQRNYDKSIVFFKRLVKEFPGSTFRKQSEFRLLILNEIQLKKEEINRLKMELDFLKKKDDEKIKKLERKIYVQKIIINELKTQIKKIKKVDIQFDKKERKVKKKSFTKHSSANMKY